MTVKLSSVRTDTKRENDGDWVDIPEWPGVRIRVRGFGYLAYQAAKAFVEARWQKQYGRQPVPPEVQYRENARLYSEHILVGWEGFDEPYSEERAAEILADPGFRELHDHIRYAGQKIMQADVEFVEDAAKNLPRSSDGSSTAGA